MRYLTTKPNGVFSLLKDDFFDDFFNVRVLNRPLNSLRTDIIEEDAQYIVNVEAPGFNKENIKVTYEDSYLNIEVEVKEEKEDKEEKEITYLRRERFAGTLSRSFYLDNVDQENITATYTDGILKIVVPKLIDDSSKVKTVTIE